MTLAELRTVLSAAKTGTDIVDVYFDYNTIMNETLKKSYPLVLWDIDNSEGVKQIRTSQKKEVIIMNCWCIKGYDADADKIPDWDSLRADLDEYLLSVNEYKPSVAYTDWFFPSLSEINYMRFNLYNSGVGEFTAAYYWNSTESASTQASKYDFATGNYTVGLKSDTNRVRACRSFTGGSYSLRDIGPAGGLIFYIDGATYYEAAPSDQSTGKAWSNITNVLIGGTGSAIGTGQANTDAIIAQAGHTDSAAKLCDDLSILKSGKSLITVKLNDIVWELFPEAFSSVDREIAVLYRIELTLWC